MFVCLKFLNPPSTFCFSEAVCLGAKTVCQRAFDYSQSGEVMIVSELVSDQEALHAVQTFLGQFSDFIYNYIDPVFLCSVFFCSF